MSFFQHRLPHMSLLCVQMSLLTLQRTLGSGGPQADGERGRKHERALAVELRVEGLWKLRVLQQSGPEEVRLCFWVGR